MNPLLERLRASRLASTFTILGTLSAGILIGSVAVHGVRGNEIQTDSSDATPLKIPNPITLSTTFTQIAKDVGPAVVNINTETLPQEETTSSPAHPSRRTGCPARRRRRRQWRPGSGSPDPNFQDFFNRFFGGQGQGGAPEQGDQVRESLGLRFYRGSQGLHHHQQPRGREGRQDFRQAYRPTPKAIRAGQARSLEWIRTLIWQW